MDKKHIGILGGGQLALMLALAAKRFAYKITILDPVKDCPCSGFADKHLVAAYDDEKALQSLIAEVDIITYEFENIPLKTVQFLEKHRPVYPQSKALEISQDRLQEKKFFQTLGFLTAPWYDITNVADLHNALAQCPNGAILKTRRMGYDGKGQIPLSIGDNDSLEQAAALLQHMPTILEEKLSFLQEVSILAARDYKGNFAYYDISENYHKDSILKQSFVPAKIPREIAEQAKNVAYKILHSLDYIGILAIEFFILKDGRLILNEMAPRVHNSGHWTECACLISQFEQHIRAISGLPLGCPKRHSNAILENILGEDMEKLDDYYIRKNVFVRLYGKKEALPKRKMGHAIFLKELMLE